MQTRIKAPWRFCTGLAGVVATLGIGTAASAEVCKLGIIADLPVTMEGTRASVAVKVNGQDTRFWLDSGAFFSFMSQARAAELGLHLEDAPFGLRMSGIGGSTAPRLATIKSFTIVGQELKNEQFLVGGSDPGNGFIGRNLLAIRDTELDLADGTVKLIDPHGCEHTVMTSSWAYGKPYSVVPLLPSENSADHSFRLPVMINGVRVEAMLDTGATHSVLRRTAARRAGIDVSAPGAAPTVVGGVGGRLVRGWVVPVAKIAIGDEQTLNAHLDVFDDSIGGSNLPDMLLGADFILSHHIYVARGQNRIYFTYSGGKPFRTSRDAAVDGVAGAGPAQPPVLPPGTHLVQAIAGNGGEPATADGLARRGAARLAAHDIPGALADLTEAIRQSPDNAAWYAERARVYAQLHDAAAMRGDIDKALALDATNGLLLRSRAVARLDAGDRAGALADAEAAARVTPPDSLASAALAEFFIRLHQPARAIAMFDAVIAAHGEDARLDDLLRGRCWARALTNVDLGKALADCNHAIRHGAGIGRLQARGLVYFRQGNFPLAIADYNAALKINPRAATDLFMRGQAEIAVGQIDAGKADQAAALAIRPKIADEWAVYGIGATGAKAS